MAYIKIFPIRVTVKSFLKYITNPNKTDEQVLVSSFGCAPATADWTFEMTHQKGVGNMRDTSGNLAWHLIQSFKPGEVTPEKAHEIGQQLADHFLKGKYEYVLATHTDRNHIHNHFAINAVSFVDYKKFRMNKSIYHRLCQISNRLCAKNGLATSMPTAEKSKTYKENMEHIRGTSWKSKLKVAVDKAIWSSLTYEEFLVKMKASGYEIREGKNLAFRAPEQKHFTNIKTLGSYYSIENVMARLEKNRHRTHSPKSVSLEVRLFISMTDYVRDDNYAGFEQWAKHHNLQEAAKTFNYLSRNRLLNYDDFIHHVEDLDSSIVSSQVEIKNLESYITEMQLVKKHCDTYRTCKRIVEQGNALSGLERMAFKKEHEAEYQLHDFEMEELKRLGIKKLPSAEKLSAEIDSLEKKLSDQKAISKKLEKQKMELSAVQNNFEEMLKTANIDIEGTNRGSDIIHPPSL